ncbi:MAG: hypothetical protein IJU81_06050 [Bacteroidales bacterium]|nr:hypothetical protein [Bacteroidales bacterium]
MTSIALCGMMACNGQQSPADEDMGIDTAAIAEEETVDLDSVEGVYYQDEPEAVAEPSQPKPSAKKETIYISGFGANGEVWGSVVMHGNKGKGTIHDAQENTLAITCTRQGNELIAIDQNSRQYIFKI